MNKFSSSFSTIFLRVAQLNSFIVSASDEEITEVVEVIKDFRDFIDAEMDYFLTVLEDCSKDGDLNA